MAKIELGDFVKVVNNYDFFRSTTSMTVKQVRTIRWEVRQIEGDVYGIVPEGSPPGEDAWEAYPDDIELIDILPPVTEEELESVYNLLLGPGHVVQARKWARGNYA